jgi:hypothetical protein
MKEINMSEEPKIMYLDEYYLQHEAGGYIGNDMLFWALNCQGYTTNISNAQVFTKEEAIKLHEARHTDIPWPKWYIDARVIQVVDMQYVNVEKALKDTGIVIKKDPPKIYYCRGCKSKISKRAFDNCTCKYCGDNLP